MKTILTPDLGDFEDVPIIEIFVNPGETIAKDDLLLAIESDKATMEIPASDGGVVQNILVKVGDTVSSGLPLIELNPTSDSDSQADEHVNTEQEDQIETAAAPASSGTYSTPEPESLESTSDTPSVVSAPTEKGEHHAQLVVLGSGPGGYTAAFRAADLGLDVILVERYDSLGGVCLNVGCIPSKALLHVAKVMSEAEDASHVGLTYSAPGVDTQKILEWKNGVVKKLTQGLAGLAKKRKVTVIQGTGTFKNPNLLVVHNDGQTTTISFDQAIIAAGSQAVEIPGFPHDDSRLMDSTDALNLEDIPNKLLIVGGGIIGLEMATVYHALGSEISIVEMMDGLMAGADADLVRPLGKRIKRQYKDIWLNTRVTEMKAMKSGINVFFEGDKAPEHQIFDKVLVSVGRTPNGNEIGLENTGVNVSDKGFIDVDNQQRTNIPHLFAIGDIVGQPMLAHKAVHEGKVAAEVAAGLASGFDARVIPSVAYTDPEVAWVGLTETEAKENAIEYEKGVFPWAASGRALTQDRSEGVTKLLFDPETDRLLGAGITGPNAGDLIAEAVLAIEMNADAQDIGLSIHPHPTLAETLGFAAEAFEGTITDLYMPKKN